MMKITPERLQQAHELAERIHWLEAEKDGVADMRVNVFGTRRSELVPGTAALARAHLAREIAAAHADLMQMGFELLPPEPVARHPQDVGPHQV